MVVGGSGQPDLKDVKSHFLMEEGNVDEVPGLTEGVVIEGSVAVLVVTDEVGVDEDEPDDEDKSNRLELSLTLSGEDEHE